MEGIDISALEAEVAQLSEEDLRSQLLDAKVKQRVATKKYYNPETAKKQRLKRAATLKQMAEKAKSLPANKPGFASLYDQIIAEAKERADEKLAAEEEDLVGVDE